MASRAKYWFAGSGILVSALGLVCFLAPYYATHTLWALRASLFVWGPILLLVAAGLAVILTLGWGRRIPVLITALLGCAGALGTLGLWLYHGYATDKVYAQSVVVTANPDDTLPEMGVRAPYSVAQAQSRTTLSGVPGAELLTDSTAYSPETHTFTTLARGRDLFGNYAAVAVQSFAMTGRSTGTQCAFESTAARVLGGWFNHNLGRSINSIKRGVSWDGGDAYGLCAEDGTPLVVVPLTRQRGVLFVTEVPAGVAVYNGRTGVTEVHDTIPEGITGPAYPASLAAKQRGSTDATGTWWQWIRNAIGWDAASGGANDGNNSELVLGERGGGSVYATLLTLKGTSTGIAAVSTVPSDETLPGILNVLTVRTLNPPWVSIDAIEARVKADYQDIPNWQTLHVQEIAPVDGNRWVATIGNDQNTLYRVMGTGNLGPYPGVADESAATCLFTGSSAEPQRCGTLALANGRGVGVQYGPDSDAAAAGRPPVAGSLPPGDLAKLSDSELAALLRRVADEVEARSHAR